MTSRQSDRRCTRRRRADDHGIVAARIRPGHHVTVIDLSPGGALVEAGHRLLPGSVVELQIQATNRQASMRGRVLRCSVSRVWPTSMCYRGAIGFDRHVPWLADAAGV